MRHKENRMTDKRDIHFPPHHPLLQEIDSVLWDRLSNEGLCPVHHFLPGEEIRTPASNSDGLGIVLSGSAIAYTPHPIKKVMKHHDGVDLPAPGGTPILAAAAGTVGGKYPAS